MFNQVSDNARKFVRENKETIKLFRSENAFDKAASAEDFDLKSKRGNKEGELKKRVAYWSAKAEHGVIGNKKDVEKFIKLSEEEVEEQEPKKRGRKPKEEKEIKGKARGKRAIAEQEKPKKNKSKKESSEESETETIDDEPTYELEVDKDYATSHNIKEFVKVFKAEFKRLGTANQDADELVKTLSKSANIRQLFELAAKIF